jgi:hypothetical protein
VVAVGVEVAVAGVQRVLRADREVIQVGREQPGRRWDLKAV